MRYERRKRTVKPYAIFAVLLCSLIAVPGLFAGGSQEAAGADKVYNLKFWSEYAETQDGVAELKVLFQELEEKSNGRIKITPYWAESLAPRPESVNALRSGLADIGKFATMFNPGEFPVCDAASLPFLIKSDRHVTNAFMKIYNEGLMPEFESTDIHIGTIVTAGSQMVLFKDKVTSINQFDGLSIRSQTPVTNALVKSLGATPVAIGGGDVFMSMEKGMVEGAISSPIFMGMMKWYEVGKYLIEDPLFYGLAFYGMNKDTWESLPADLQAIMTEWFKDVAEYEIGQGDGMYQKFRKVMVDNGVQMLHLPPAELKTWANKSSFIIDDYVNDLKARNLEGQKIIDIIKSSEY